jgi:MHS family proline/betaine transporter-like MFS transporter
METVEKKTFRKIFWTSYMGNCIEMYDYVLLGVLLPRLSGMFIGDASIKETFFFGLFAFMAAGLARPAGGILFGHIGDKYGRKHALFWTLCLMSTCSVGIALLPSYSQIGYFSTIFFMLFRIGQGISMGGEGLGAAVYLLESMDKDKGQGTKVSATYATSNGVGPLLAISLSLLITHPVFPEWSWKCLFLIGGLVAITGFIIRRTLPDSPDFERSKGLSTLSKMPIHNLFASFKTQIFLGVLYVGIGSALSFVGYAFLNMYLQKVSGLSQSIALGYAMFSMALAASCVFGLGRFLSFKRYNLHSIMKTGCYFVIVASYPMMYFLKGFGATGIIISIILLSLMTACIVSVIPLYLSSLFPTQLRYSGACFTGNVAAAIIGNAYPLYAFWIIDVTDNRCSPAFLLITLSISFCIFSRFLSSSSHTTLTKGIRHDRLYATQE